VASSPKTGSGNGERDQGGSHLDLRIPPEVVEDRIAAAIEAGDELVDDTAAPAFWVLADPQGNRACLTTWHGGESL
jgi:4a-hydroxytetrahydrobiopterin dehydratase